MGTLLEVRQETKYHFSVATGILGFLSDFMKCQALSPFEAVNSVFLSKCQTDVRPPVKMSWGPRAILRVSTVVSDIPSPCKMKDELAYKPLQGNLAFFQVRASRCPLKLRQHIQGPSHIPIAEGSSHLRCFWKVGIPLQLKPGNQLSRDN